MRPHKIDELLNSSSESDRETCISLLEQHLEKQRNDAKSQYDLACCFDFLGREVESKRILLEGQKKFPDSFAVKIFLGFTLYSMDEHKEASQVLLEMASHLPSEILDGYERAVRWYEDRLT